jgi:hypothetical protein
MKEHMRLYNENKKAAMDIVCEDCLVKITCSQCCEDMDYLLIMCADVRHHMHPKQRSAEILAVAREVKRYKLEQLEEGVSHG